MKTNYRHQRRDQGLEIAMTPNDLRICGNFKIVEKNSTSGFEEVPQIRYPLIQENTNRMIQFDQYWGVIFNWRVDGLFARLLDCGLWKCKVLFEQMGGGETSFNPEAITQDQGCPGYEYKAEIEIPPHSLKPGVYRVICCLQYCFENKQPGPIAGFHDLGLVKVFHDDKGTHSISAGNGVTQPETV